MKMVGDSVTLLRNDGPDFYITTGCTSLLEIKYILDLKRTPIIS